MLIYMFGQAAGVRPTPTRPTSRRGVGWGQLLDERLRVHGLDQVFVEAGREHPFPVLRRPWGLRPMYSRSNGVIPSQIVASISPCVFIGP